MSAHACSALWAPCGVGAWAVGTAVVPHASAVADVDVGACVVVVAYAVVVVDGVVPA